MVSCESNTAWICKIRNNLWPVVEVMCNIAGEKSTRMHPPKITSYRREPDSTSYAEEEKKVKQKHLSPLRRRLSNRWNIAINHAFKKVRGWSSWEIWSFWMLHHNRDADLQLSAKGQKDFTPNPHSRVDFWKINACHHQNIPLLFISYRVFMSNIAPQRSIVL